MANITKAVHELESKHGPINDIPEAIMIDWRAEHDELLSGDRPYIKSELHEGNRVKALRVFNTKVAKENAKNKAWLDVTIPKEVVRGKKNDALRIYSTELADAVQYINKLSNTNIAKKVGVKYAKVASFIARVTRKRYYFLTTEGVLYKDNTVIGLQKKIIKDGYPFSSSHFSKIINRGGYFYKGKKVVGKISKQLIIKRVQVVDTVGKIIKEV